LSLYVFVGDGPSLGMQDGAKRQRCFLPWPWHSVLRPSYRPRSPWPQIPRSETATRQPFELTPRHGIAFCQSMPLAERDVPQIPFRHARGERSTPRSVPRLPLKAPRVRPSGHSHPPHGPQRRPSVPRHLCFGQGGLQSSPVNPLGMLQTQPLSQLLGLPDSTWRLLEGVDLVAWSRDSCGVARNCGCLRLNHGASVTAPSLSGRAKAG